MDLLEIRNLREKGFSYSEICQRFDFSRSSVIRACSKVKMSEEGLLRHSCLNGMPKKLVFDELLSDSKIRIMSNLLFDGAVYKDSDYHYCLMYVNSTNELIQQFAEDMKKVYNIKPSTWEISERFQRLKYNSKIVYDDLIKYFKSYSTSSEDCIIPDEIMGGSNSFKIIILQAFWENEGSISQRGKLTADSKSLKVINQLSRLHNEFGLKHNITRYIESTGFMYKIVLSKSKENYRRFMDLGLFSKANVTKGFNKGRKKIEVLKGFL